MSDATSGLTYVVTGSGSGIGAAVAARLRADGHRVIGVDRTETDVTADLSTAAGRADAVARIATLAPDGIAGLVPCVENRRWTDSSSDWAISVHLTTPRSGNRHPGQCEN